MRTPYQHGYEDALDRGWNASGQADEPGAYEYSKGYAAGQLELSKRTPLESRIRTLEAELDEQAELIRDLEKSLDQARADARVLAAEVRAWRSGEVSLDFYDKRLHDGIGICEDTNASGALERNKL